MMRYVALLRGINVGGNTMIKMEVLRQTFETLGFENVKTYINSGNVGFDCRKSAEKKLEDKIEQAVEKEVGRPIAVVIRTKADIERILRTDPFKGEYTSHKEMHVLFLKDPLPKEKQADLANAALEGERYVVEGLEIYCHLAAGFAESLLTKGLLDKKLKVVYTARNWRTVQALASL